ncbi:RICIN domain-containing protein [Streptomyces sp. NPDC002265]|uniref:RICIN domain-containing protein n=1 Tax=Streptomyces sp. NPDC002265 TaxID=3154415 RepID=UPI003330C2CE
MAQGGGDAHTGASDARLTELLRADTASAYPALQEIRARHQPSVLGYARLCVTGEAAARQLAAQTFTAAARETARGTDPDVPLRHRLLLLTGSEAASWATDGRAAGLDPGLLLVLNTARPDGPVPPMLAAFRSLPSRTQGLIWYGLVEREPETRTAAFLGLTEWDVRHGTPQALPALGQACLRARLAASDDPRCGDFRRLIEESARPDNPRHSPDLHAHMTRCPHCTSAYEELSALRDDPRTALAEGLLPWGGTAYARSGAAAATRVIPRADARVTDPSAPRTRPWTGPQSRRIVLASAALSAVLVPLLLFLNSSDGSQDRQQSAGAAAVPSSPPVTVTATATYSAPAPSASPTRTSPSPTHSSARPRPTTRKPTPTPTPSPAARPPGAAYAQVVNVSTGRCLDVAGDFDDGTDVVTASCSGSDTQRWRVDADRGVLQSYADPDFCLDSRGDVDNGVGVWSCDSVYGRHGQNLTFTVDDDGVIRPAIAIETGVTPQSYGDGVSLEPLSGGPEQRWRAGSA